MLHTGLIAPVSELLERHRKGAAGQGRLLGRAEVGHLRAARRPHGVDRGRPVGERR